MNQFYTDFDKERLDGAIPSDYRTPFQRDRDRIIHSAAFRRLQGKTQVFLSGEYDFYRTRLTHSIEVAQIGRSISYYLQHTHPAFGPEFHVDPDLVEATCLAHDIGHPPFGHAGERVLHHCLRATGGFEGNAQTLRILASTLYPDGRSGRKGMNPTRALLDGVLKYRSLHRELQDPEHHFLYDEQAALRDWILPGAFVLEAPAGKERDSLKPIECQIMDWADDTAYGVNDIADGIQAGYITIQSVERWMEATRAFADCAPFANALLTAIHEQRSEAHLASRISDFIHGCHLEERPDAARFPGNRYRYCLRQDEDIARRCQFYKALAVDLVFRSTPLQHLEHKGRCLVESLFRVFTENEVLPAGRRLTLLPENFQARVRAAKRVDERHRLIADYLSGMTDAFATKSYRRLLGSDGGSISDRI